MTSAWYSSQYSARRRQLHELHKAQFFRSTGVSRPSSQIGMSPFTVSLLVSRHDIDRYQLIARSSQPVGSNPLILSRRSIAGLSTSASAPALTPNDIDNATQTDDVSNSDKPPTTNRQQSMPDALELLTSSMTSVFVFNKDYGAAERYPTRSRQFRPRPMEGRLAGGMHESPASRVSAVVTSHVSGDALFAVGFGGRTHESMTSRNRGREDCQQSNGNDHMLSDDDQLSIVDTNDESSDICRLQSPPDVATAGEAGSHSSSTNSVNSTAASSTNLRRSSSMPPIVTQKLVAVARGRSTRGVAVASRETAVAPSSGCMLTTSLKCRPTVGSQLYVDPIVDAPTDFQQRISELTTLQLDTIRWEKVRRPTQQKKQR